MIMIDYQGLLREKEIPAYIKEAIRVILNKGSFTVGKWLNGMSTVDVLSMMESTDDLLEEIRNFSGGGALTLKEAPAAESCLVLIGVLSSAEALDISDQIRDLLPLLGKLKIMLAVEYITRTSRGELHACHENMTLGDEFGKRDLIRTSGEGVRVEEKTLADKINELIKFPSSLTGKGNSGPKASLAPSTDPVPEPQASKDSQGIDIDGIRSWLGSKK